ncbi:hypothetical protein DFAR_2030015 [Desulfarculales bacterium]
MIRLRPWGYWSRFQAPVETTRQGLFNKLARDRWDLGLPRFRQRHWLKGLLRQVRPIPGVKLFGRPAWGLRLVQWPRPAGRRKVRALSFPEPSTQGCRCPGPIPRSTHGRDTLMEDRHG